MLTTERPLVGLHLACADLGNAGQCGHGLMLEQITGTEQQAVLPRPTDQLDRDDRVAAELEEVVTHAHLRQLQHALPQRGKTLLQGIAWRHVGLLQGAEVGCRQCFAVELAVGQQRQLLKHQPVGRQHVVRQALAQRRLQLLALLGRPVCGNAIGQHQVSRQLLAAWAVDGYHHGLAHLGAGQQARLDFAQFDTEAADFYLVIDPPQVIELPVGAQANLVTGAVQARTLGAKRVGHEALGRQPRAPQVAAGQAGTAQVQLPGHACWQKAQGGVQHTRTALADRLADRCIGAVAMIPGAGTPDHRRDHGLGGAIPIDHHLGLQALLHPLVSRPRHGIAAKAVKTNRWRVTGMRRMLGQLLQVGRRESGHGHPMPAYLLVGALGAPQLIVAQQQAATHDQRGQPAFMSTVEGKRQEMQLTVRRGHFVPLASGQAVHGQRPVCDRNAFGLAGRTRGVDHVGQVLWVQCHGGCMVGARLLNPLVEQQRTHAGLHVQARQHPAVTEQQVDAAVLHHVGQALCRVLGVQRQERAPGLENAQQTDNHVERTLQGDAHQHVGADTQRPQAVCQLVGPGLELAVAQLLVADQQRYRLRLALGLFGNQLVDRRRRGREPRLLPALQQCRLLLGRQQRQLADSLGWVGSKAAQQVAPVLSHALQGSGFEQLGSVEERHVDRRVGLQRFQGQVELRGATLQGHFLGMQTCQAGAANLLAGNAEVVVHHLEQRVAVQRALRVQGFDQAVERQVLMRLAGQRRGLDLAEQRRAAHGRVDFDAHDQGIDEKAQDVFQLLPATVAHRYADAYIGLFAVALQQQGKSPEEQLEQGQLMLTRQLPQALRQFAVQGERDPPQAVVFQRATRVVDWQFQDGLLASQLPAPVVQLALELALVEPVLVPGSVIGVLDRQLGQCRRLAPVQGLVQGNELTHHHAHRTTIGNDVVQGDHQQLVLLAQLQHLGAPQRTGAQVEQPLGLGQYLSLYLCQLGRCRQSAPGQR
ncbi:hypothetical protein D3C80_349450 [compost metagenome]